MITHEKYICMTHKHITADGNCSHEIKRHFLLGGKAVTNLGNVLKSRNSTLSTKIHIVKAMVFPVVMYQCENWTIKKFLWWKIDAFKLWYWRRLLRIPWTGRRSNQPILKERCWSWSSTTLATWFNWEKNSDTGKDWGQEENGTTEDEMVGWHHRLNGHKFEQILGVSEGQGSLACCSPWDCKE